MRVQILIALSFCLVLPLLGAEKIAPSVQEIAVDASKSNVQFALNAVLHTVHGTFKVWSGV